MDNTIYDAHVRYIKQNYVDDGLFIYVRVNGVQARFPHGTSDDVIGAWLKRTLTNKHQ